MEHDFVTVLQKQYLEDLDKRKLLGQNEKSTFIDFMRKNITLDMMSGVVNEEYKKIGGLKKSADELEKELEAERKAREHAKKVKALVT